MKKPRWGWLWVVLLLKANHKETSMIWNGNVVLIKEGQFITGRKELAKQSGLPESTVEDILKYLENQHQIQQQKTTKYRLITIVNWEKYQNSTSIPTTEQQQSNTNKNDNKEKNTTTEIGISGLRVEKYTEDKPVKAKPVLSQTKAYESMVKWAEVERGFPFLSTERTKQYKALKLAQENKLKAEQLRERFSEMLSDKFWGEKGFDWMNVVKSFNNKQ